MLQDSFGTEVQLAPNRKSWLGKSHVIGTRVPPHCPGELRVRTPPHCLRRVESSNSASLSVKSSSSCSASLCDYLFFLLVLSPVKDKTDGRSLGKKGIFQILVNCAYAVELSLLLAFDRRIHLFELTTLSTPLLIHVIIPSYRTLFELH